MQRLVLAKRVYLFLFLIVIAFYLYGLGFLPLLGPDEPRYAQVAREMFLRKDLITPTLGGYTWFEKPALLYWTMMASYSLFGVSEWTARLGPALCGLLTIVAVWCVARRVERRLPGERNLAFWSMLVCASLLGLIVFSRAASFDIVVTMTTTWALAFLLLHELQDTTRRFSKFLVGFYAAVGLSLLAKGLVGIVIPFGVAFVYYLLRRTWPAKTVIFSLLWGGPVAAAVAALWYGPAMFTHGWSFVDEFFLQHHFARFVSNKYHHPQPIYFYPAILLMLTVPWTPVLVEALINSRRWQWRNPDHLNIARVFSFAWLVLPILFFSFSGSKLPGYILPVLPAAALLIGERVDHFSSGETNSNWALKATGLVCLIFGVGCLVFASRSVELTIVAGAVAAAPMILGGVFVLVTRWNAAAAVTIGVATLVMVMLILNVAAPFANRESVRDLLKLADERGYANTPVLAQRGDDRSAEFYAGERVVYRADGEPTTIDEITVDRARRIGKMLVFVPVQHLDPLQQTPGMELIGNNGRLALLGWQPQ